MRNVWLLIAVIGLQNLLVVCQAANNVNALRYWTQQDEARLVFDVGTLEEHNIYTLQNPPRLVVDFKDAKLTHTLGKPKGNNGFIADIESGVFNESNLRVVIELKKNIIFKDFTLPPNKSYGNRLVVDLYTANNASNNETKKFESLKTATVQNDSNKESTKPSVSSLTSRSNADKAVDYASEKSNTIIYAPKQSAKEIIVAIDAGHGGEDPGAHGPGGTEEKRVVLAIARKLENLIKRHPGMTPVMVRDGDHFIKLRKRIDIARNKKADLFVSIHADAYRDASVRGTSVFTLSQHGASSEAARWLADSENSADLIGGVSLDDKDDMLASVLLDLSQTATIEASTDVARKVLSHFKQVNPLHKAAVQKAGFLVLKSPDIPSILVETAFISNPSEEAKLRSEEHQEKNGSCHL